MFSSADTLRFFMFLSLRLQRKRTILLHFSDKFPFQESRISAIVNVCFCCGNAKFRQKWCDFAETLGLCQTYLTWPNVLIILHTKVLTLINSVEV